MVENPPTNGTELFFFSASIKSNPSLDLNTIGSKAHWPKSHGRHQLIGCQNFNKKMEWKLGPHFSALIKLVFFFFFFLFLRKINKACTYKEVGRNGQQHKRNATYKILLKQILNGKLLTVIFSK